MDQVTTPAPGRFAARVLKALAACRGDLLAARGFVDRTDWLDRGQIKAAVDTIATGDGLATGAAAAGADFVEYLRPFTLLGRMLDRVRRVPDRVALIRQTAGGRAGWVAEGEALALPVSTFQRVAGLPLRRVGAIHVVTEDLAQASDAENILLRDLRRACVEALDGALADQMNGGTTATPASVFYGSPSITSTGNLAQDFDALVSLYTGDLSTAVIVADSRTAAQIATEAATLGGCSIDLTGATQSRLFGLPAYFSDSVARDSNGGFLGIFDADRLEVAGFRAAELGTSTEAMIEMDTEPDNPTTASSVMTSLWQQNLIGLRATIAVNWRLVGGAAAFVHHIAY